MTLAISGICVIIVIISGYFLFKRWEKGFIKEYEEMMEGYEDKNES